QTDMIIHGWTILLRLAARALAPKLGGRSFPRCQDLARCDARAPPQERRGHAEAGTEACREVAVTGETEVERYRGQVPGRVEHFIECGREPNMLLILMERRAREAPEDTRQMKRRAVDAFRQLTEGPGTSGRSGQNDLDRFHHFAVAGTRACRHQLRRRRRGTNGAKDNDPRAL